MITIPLDTSSSMPLYEQIYQYIKEEIINGSLIKNEKLPSTRSLANHLQVSRNTVDMAYAQLVSEGYIDSKPKKGYFVNSITPIESFAKQSDTPVSVKVQPPTTNIQYRFSPFAIDLDRFPYHTWTKLTKSCLADHPDLFLLGDSQGDWDFRVAIHNYLHQSRGVNCHPNQIIIGAGVDYLLQLLAQLFDQHSIIAMENPTYLRAYQILQGFHHPITPINVTQTGLDIDQLEESNANIAYVTPSHQYPLGVIMPIHHRMKLLEWAAKDEQRYIIEDDHDSEFRYIGKPIPSLQGIDRNEKVIYIGTFSKAIAPAIRIGYMVLPTKLLDLYHTKLSYYSCTVSRIDQRIMTSFLDDGYFERHLNRMKKTYKAKHDAMIHALKQFTDSIRIIGENAGLYIVIQLITSVSEEEIIAFALQHKIQLYGVKHHYIHLPEHYHPTFLMGYGDLSEEDIQTGIQQLSHLLKTENLI